MSLAEVLESLARLPDTERVALLERMPEKRRKEVVAGVMSATASMRFVPHPGPQTMAYRSKADVLGYGGQAGSGKSALLVGLASQEHQRSIIFRRELTQTDGLEEFGRKLIGETARFTGSPAPEWNWDDGKTLKLAGMKETSDWVKHAGRERDFLGYDEAAEFTEEQVSSLMAWNRGPTGQRCRVVFASNPPRSSDGAWFIKWFAPWLDRQFHKPANPGELRWACMVKGAPVWVDGPGEHEFDSETYRALSFTFIPASLKDNPDRDTPEYRARLQSLPEPLRSQLLYGHFDLDTEDDPWQLIPTAWVRAAQERWKPQPPAGVPMCSIGADVAQGGADNTVLARRHDTWFAPLVKVPGSQTPGGTDVAALVLKHRHDNAMVVTDVGGGWGGAAHGHLIANGVDSKAYMGIKPSTGRTADRQLGFRNVRSEAHWRLREALDPDQLGGAQIALPPDRSLLADLTALRYSVQSNGISVEAKADVMKRLGRSPDDGDAVVMCWWAGAKAGSIQGGWQAFNRDPVVKSGRTPLSRRVRS